MESVHLISWHPFTNKATKEMSERIASIVGDGEARSISMGTFHSVFF